MRDRKVWAWALYDWANSAFATTIMAGFFPVFFKQYSNAGVPAALSTFRFGLTSSIAAIIVAVMTPLLGALSDRSGQRKRPLLLFALLGCAATAGLATLSEGAWIYAALLFAFASIGFNSSLVFYDSLLAEVSVTHDANAVSSFGFALGYLGGGLLFAANLLMFSQSALFGLPSSLASVKASFVTVGIWWFVFSLPLFFLIPEQSRNRETLKGAFVAMVRELRESVRHITRTRPLVLFLVAYWLYIDGIYTIIKMAVDYGSALGLSASHLMLALLMTQFIAFPAALVFGSMARRFHAVVVIETGLAVYVGITIWASMLHAAWEFFALAGLIALVQGGVQAISRSHFLSLVPRERAAEYFSFYNMVGKFAAILGPALMGVVSYLSDSPRAGVLSLLLLFFSGAWLLRKSVGAACS